jgi:2'-deoxynucleoside 5'-phosphate N-hydrolase
MSFELGSKEMDIYFAGSIRGGRADCALYEEIIAQLGVYGRVLTEHVGAVQLDVAGEQTNDRAIYERDMTWLRRAQVVVAEVTTPSLGVGYEIGKATEWGKPVLCLFRPGAGRALSAMIGGSSGVVVRAYDSAAELPAIFRAFFRAVV